MQKKILNIVVRNKSATYKKSYLGIEQIVLVRGSQFGQLGKTFSDFGDVL
jgi:hypothetical protein